MTLATRCPACGTVFRVVQDQLRVSQGWVRCGRCTEAFNAMETMVDWPATQLAESQTEAVLSMTAAHPPEQSAPAEEPAAVASVAAPEQEAQAWADAAPAPQPEIATPFETAHEPADESTAEPALEPTLEPAHESAVEPMPIDVPPGVALIASDGAVSSDVARAFDQGLQDAPRTEPSFGFDAVSGDAPQDLSSVAPAADPDGPDAMPAPAPAPIVPAAAAPAAPVDEAAAELPSFVLKANRAERWRRPGVRVALATVAVLALCALVAQAGYTFRDRIAAGSPTWRPWLQQACATLGCRVGEYRQIDALSVESSALVKVEGAPVYRLAVTLRNRAALDVAAPAIDLSITDAQGRQIARRVLQMSDLNLPLRSLKAGSELPIQASLSIGDRQVSGYTVEIFYP